MRGSKWAVTASVLLGTALLAGPVGAQGRGPCGGGGRWGQGAGQGRGYGQRMRAGGQGQGRGSGVLLRRRDGSCLYAGGWQGQPAGQAQRSARGAGRGYGYGNGPRDGSGPNPYCPLKK